MTDIIEATYHFLDTLDNSELIKKLARYKNNLLNNQTILKDINDLKKETDPKVIIAKRKVLFNNNDYKMYLKYYNELSLIILKINKKYQEYTNTIEHNCNK